MTDMIKLSRNFFYDWLKKYPNGPYKYDFHVPEVERWAKFILKKHPEIDSEVALISIWLHDIGSYPISKKDHAVVGESIAKKFLKKYNYNSEKTKMVLHCIRAHRCRDVMPQSMEAKLVACCDSASHLTDYIYLSILVDARSTNSKELASYALDKLERDYKDLSTFPEIQRKLTLLFVSWKNILNEYQKVNID